MIQILFTLDDGAVHTEKQPSGERIRELRTSAKVLWVDMDNPNRVEIDLVLDEIFGFHHLSIDDCLNENHHPKIDVFEDHLFVITNGIPDLDEGEFFRERRINAFVGESFLVTFHLHKSMAVREVFSECLTNPAIAAKGSDHIYHKILDITTDQYLAALDVISGELEVMEDAIFQELTSELLNDIIMEKRQVLTLHRSILHQRDILNRLSTESFHLITKQERLYYRNVYDHLMRLSDSIDFYREQVNALLSVYLSVSSNKMNEVMKVLTIIATMMLPLTLIAGIYGMNFDTMPELHWKLGYPMSIGMMVLVTAGFLWYFRRKKWF